MREAEAVNRVPNLEAEEIAAIESAFKAGPEYLGTPERWEAAVLLLCVARCASPAVL
jgi:hypothetical protein